MMPRRARRGAIFGMPILVGTASLVGLVVGLLGDGWFDILSGLAVAVPAAVIGWSLAKARRADWDR
ncbi:hypothetical protein ACFO8O_00025 [Hephaestia sp. GCM10023244]|uniref:hypothetical protein n=1 Tax=unclassified Hephaestia TaxID=2631281 RepID=UPI002076EF8F|nr:hypothetical protein [Hephaestia sp. MAHUQ-44]MCM8729352.1 hypothetical protein [Hephaestia sp. MAHUQ-44]